MMLLVCTLFAQNKVNPFEIKPRLNSLPKAELPLPKTDTLSNSVMSDTNHLPTNTLPHQAETDPTGKFKNPFEVDHLPERKKPAVNQTNDIKSLAEKTKESPRFLFLFLIIGCAILAIVLNINRKSIILIYKSLYNENILKLFYREESIKPSSFTILMYLIFFINLAAFIYLYILPHNGPTGILTYSAIMGIIILIYIIRHSSLAVLGRIFSIVKSTDLYSFTIMIFNHFIGLVLLPINFLLAFGPANFKPAIMTFTIVFLSGIYILRLIRGIFIVSNYFSDRLFQIIVYLCAFEIAPTLILVKTIMKWLV
jgi:hypothetical protein